MNLTRRNSGLRPGSGRIEDAYGESPAAPRNLMKCKGPHQDFTKYVYGLFESPCPCCWSLFRRSLLATSLVEVVLSL